MSMDKEIKISKYELIFCISMFPIEISKPDTSKLKYMIPTTVKISVVIRINILKCLLKSLNFVIFFILPIISCVLFLTLTTVFKSFF